MTQQDPFPEEAIRDWLKALQSKPETPEVIALQRQLLDLLYRAARQLPEVQALVRAARAALEEDLGVYAGAALADALKPFEEP